MNSKDRQCKSTFRCNIASSRNPTIQHSLPHVTTGHHERNQINLDAPMQPPGSTHQLIDAFDSSLFCESPVYQMGYCIIPQDPRVAGVDWLSATAAESLRAFVEHIFANFCDNFFFTFEGKQAILLKAPHKQA